MLLNELRFGRKSQGQEKINSLSILLGAWKIQIWLLFGGHWGSLRRGPGAPPAHGVEGCQAALFTGHRGKQSAHTSVIFFLGDLLHN